MSLSSANPPLPLCATRIVYSVGPNLVVNQVQENKDGKHSYRIDQEFFKLQLRPNQYPPEIGFFGFSQDKNLLVATSLEVL